MPLAISPEGVCASRAAAAAHLDALGRGWRTAYESQAFAAQRIAVAAGLAIAATLPRLIGPDIEILDSETTGLSELPTMDIRLYRSPGRAGQAAACLAELIIERVRDSRNTG